MKLQLGTDEHLSKILGLLLASKTSFNLEKCYIHTQPDLSKKKLYLKGRSYQTSEGWRAKASRIKLIKSDIQKMGYRDKCTA